MTVSSVLPSTREQAYHALTLLGVPVGARTVVAVHGALFDGDLTVGALTGQLRMEERGVGPLTPYRLCVALTAADLTPARGLIALSTWALTGRISTPTSVRVDTLTAVVRVAEFAAVQPGASPTTARLLHELAAQVPGGPEAYRVMDPGALADAARAALTAPGLVAAAEQDRVVREAAAERAAARLDERQLLFGVRQLPRPRNAGGANR
jgi:hypothetical protein